MLCMLKNDGILLLQQFHSTSFPNSNNNNNNESQIPTRTHKEHRVLPFHPRHFFQVVSDVNSYSNFLPYCQKSKILRYSECSTMFDAVLQIGFLSIKEEYISRVRTIIKRSEDSNNENDNNSKEEHYFYVIQTKSIRESQPNGIIESISSQWIIQQSPTTTDNKHDESMSCMVKFEMEMQLSSDNFVIQKVLDQVWENIAKGQVDAFQKRCHNTPFLENN